jgi:Uma2 family endonuclease
MGATTTMVTVREFLQLPEPEGQRMELIGGELVCLGRGGYAHEWVKSNLIEILGVWLMGHRSLKLLSESAFQIDELNSPIPDISLVLREGARPGAPGLIHGAPELAIEVVSSETAGHLESKIALYLGHGTKSVWAVFPEQRHVRIFDVNGGSTRFGQDQTLEDSSVLPGFSTPVSAIFEGI